MCIQRFIYHPTINRLESCVGSCSLLSYRGTNKVKSSELALHVLRKNITMNVAQWPIHLGEAGGEVGRDGGWGRWESTCCPVNEVSTHREVGGYRVQGSPLTVCPHPGPTARCFWLQEVPTKSEFCLQGTLRLYVLKCVVAV